MFITLWKSVAPWVLLLVQESYLLYINWDYKKLDYIIYTTILKNHMGATLDTIIGEKQSVAIKNNNITHIFHNSTCNWCFTKVIQQSCLNIFEFFWIFHKVDWDFMAFVSLFYHKFLIHKFILPFLSLVMETNSFTRLKLHTPISNLKLKKWSPIWTFYPYMRSSPGVSTLILLYVTVAEVPAIFTDADTRIKGVQIGDHKIKQ